MAENTGTKSQQTNGNSRGTGITEVCDVVKYVSDTALIGKALTAQFPEAGLRIDSNQELLNNIREPTNDTVGRQKPRGLLDLPRELRDLIYVHVIGESTTSLRSANRPRHVSNPSHLALKPSPYATNSGMVGLNRQVREQLTEMLCSAPEIKLTVRISEYLNFRHAVKMVESWITHPNGRLTKCPLKITITIDVHDWDEIMILEDSWRRNRRNAIHSVNRWLKAWSKVSDLPGAPKISYTSQGTAQELSAFKWFLINTDPASGNVACSSHCSLIIWNVKQDFERVNDCEIEAFYRRQAIDKFRDPIISTESLH
ncbi:uncharacterized protein RCC_00391 [Ramularia collo-cygni]|uniref:F-box domain-containing protein n=1 Tax=Ramularia collo-cygni TaxID=112498 RepID=A0A2D3UWI0_9PEZI|nr:uncharacterized protein RCC_00391 [Ramularia collo-cygni]CZT14414.1 uncharacterized protein RCC_00391 [Ramularia collo-cygni]